MRSSTHSSCLGLVAALCVAIALPVYAAAGNNTIYMSIDSKEGQLKKIPVISVEAVMQSPRDAASGMASGKRQHTPIKIVKEVGTASPQLQKMAETNEVLPQIVFEFTVDTGGKQQVSRTMKLINAQVKSVQRTGTGKTSAKGSSKEREEISLTYQRVEETDSNGKKTFTDSWTQ